MQHLKDYIFAETENYRGWVAPEFHDLAMQFSRLQNARSQQGGAALAVYFQGQKVVDIYTGKRMTFFYDPDNLPLEIHE